jgi:hypothetical protein
MIHNNQKGNENTNSTDRAQNIYNSNHVLNKRVLISSLHFENKISDGMA